MEHSLCIHTLCAHSYVSVLTHFIGIPYLNMAVSNESYPDLIHKTITHKPLGFYKQRGYIVIFLLPLSTNSNLVK